MYRENAEATVLALSSVVVCCVLTVLVSSGECGPGCVRKMARGLAAASRPSPRSGVSKEGLEAPRSQCVERDRLLQEKADHDRLCERLRGVVQKVLVASCRVRVVVAHFCAHFCCVV